MAILEVPDIEAVGESAGGAIKRSVRFVARCHRTAVDAERQRNECVAKERALNMRKRQYAFEHAVAFGIEKEAFVPEAPFDDPLPAGTMEKRRARTLLDEAVPIGDPRVVELPDAWLQAHHCNATEAVSPSRNTWSMRAHRKSRSRRLRRASILRRLR